MTVYTEQKKNWKNGWEKLQFCEYFQAFEKKKFFEELDKIMKQEKKIFLYEP